MPARAPKIDDEVRDLYQGHLGDFTAGRQALAKRLRQAGDARAAEVAGLAKPPLSAWAVNRLFAREPKGVAALVGAGERARAAQRKVVAKGDPAALRQAIEAARAEVERLTGRGAAILTEAERAPGEAIVERLRTNLEALAFNPATAPVAERGWLDEDLEPPGFEVLAGLQLAAAGGRPAAAAKTPPAKPAGKKPATVHGFEEGRRAAVARRERAAQEDAERRERAREAVERRERIEQAKAELRRAETEVDARRRESERADRAAEEARGKLERSREAATRAREALETAERS
ncbi:MAG TPA: hypothetical protein VGC93_13880 [Thermoanaerobaculia bacterium]